MTQSGALLELQSVDLELLRARKQLDELPEKMEILTTRAKRRQVKTMRSKAEILVRKLEAEVRARQDEAEMHATKIEAEQAKIMETSDHRQVQALTREMDGLKRRVDKLEMEQMQFLERTEKASAQIATIDEALDSLGAKEAGLVERFKTSGGIVQQRIVQLEADRARLAGAISAELLARYEEIRASKGGIGVGRLEGETCSACHMALPAERVRDLREGSDIGVCPACRRLIVVRSEDAA